MLFSEISYICHESLAKFLKALCSTRKRLLVLQQVVCCYHWDLKGESELLRNLQMKFTKFIVGMLSENDFYPLWEKIYTFFFIFNAYIRPKFAV
jgi:hypothetical protein